MKRFLLSNCFRYVEEKEIKIAKNTMDVKLELYLGSLKVYVLKFYNPVGSKSQISTKYYLLICISRQNS
jgi:hypothetical protein